MCNGIEKAFDRLQLCFLPDTNGDLVVRILDDKVAMYDFRTYDGVTHQDNSPPKKVTADKYRQFLSIEGRKLCYKHPPWRRVLWLHAYVAIGHMQKCAWNACNPLALTVESDRAYRRLSEENPFGMDGEVDGESKTEFRDVPPSAGSSMGEQSQVDQTEWTDGLEGFLQSATGAQSQGNHDEAKLENPQAQSGSLIQTKTPRAKKMIRRRVKKTTTTAPDGTVTVTEEPM